MRVIGSVLNKNRDILFSTLLMAGGFCLVYLVENGLLTQDALDSPWQWLQITLARLVS